MSDYEIHVCPVCAAQCSYDGGYEGEGWEFPCGHDLELSSTHGLIEPVRVAVPGGAVDVPDQAVALEAQRVEHKRRLLLAAESRKARRAALSPAERDAEDRVKARMDEICDELVVEMRRDFGRMVFGESVAPLSLRPRARRS